MYKATVKPLRVLAFLLICDIRYFILSSMIFKDKKLLYNEKKDSINLKKKQTKILIAFKKIITQIYFKLI
jgi:hypothetical protein